MTTTTPSADCRGPHRRPDRRAFTLTEVMLAATLSAFMTAGVLSTFLMVGRSGLNASSYSEIEAQVRRGLAIFAADVRQATDLRWINGQSVTLTLPTATDATTLVTYAYDAAPGSATGGCFYRQEGPLSATGARQVLVRGVAADFAFRRYKVAQPGVSGNTAANDAETKQIRLDLRAARTGTTAAATQQAFSARFILRNKRVSN